MYIHVPAYVKIKRPEEKVVIWDLARERVPQMLVCQLRYVQYTAKAFEFEE